MRKGSGMFDKNGKEIKGDKFKIFAECMKEAMKEAQKGMHKYYLELVENEKKSNEIN